MDRPRKAPPETSPRTRRAVETVLRPLEQFLAVEASSGIGLLAAAGVALGWANSPWGASYEALWHVRVTLGIGSHVVAPSLHFLINDGLMTIFFFVAGLEIRREIHEGELADRRRATLPIAAALGGMLVPAAVYVALNVGRSTSAGWGIPMATDIAFASAVLLVLGKRVPPALRVLLLALAIIDDIGAILVIAFFYSGGIQVGGLLVAGAGVAGIFVLQRIGVRRSWVYVLPGAIVWFGFLRAGVHPTIGGVVVGLATPVKTWFGEAGFIAVSRDVLETVERRAVDAHALLPSLRRLRQAQREVVSPLIRVQAQLHPWVSYVIMPLFALANAGVALGNVRLEPGDGARAVLGIALGLVLGKPAGILLASWITVRLGICALPSGVGWSGILLVGMVAGIGFTMAIFVAGLAFPDDADLSSAKLAVLTASIVTALVSFAVGRVLLPRQRGPLGAGTASEAEASAEL